MDYYDKEEDILKKFVKNIMFEIFIIDTKVAPTLITEVVNKKDTFIERIIKNNLGIVKGNRVLYRRTLNFIYRNPHCWNGNYYSAGARLQTSALLFFHI